MQLNDVVGLGTSLTVTCLSLYPTVFEVHATPQMMIAWAFLCAAVTQSAVWFTYMGYAQRSIGTVAQEMKQQTQQKMFAISLVILYVIFISIQLIVELADPS